MPDIDKLMNDAVSWVEGYLKDTFDSSLEDDITVKACMYSLMAGGKRIRPLLCYLTADMLKVSKEAVLPFAAALEMVHTYSLIHDDLPSMDNDDLRRGKPTCHKAFGEGIAVLAGDCLLNRAFETVTYEVAKEPSYAKAAYEFASLSGINGMVGGQSIDLASEGQTISLDRLRELQRKKTGALLKAAVMLPYYMFSTSFGEDLGKELSGLSECLGLAFQIKDDILDFESDEETLGKSIGKDERDNKSTFVTILGMQGAKDELKKNIEGCYNHLGNIKNMGYDISGYEPVIGFFAGRDH